MKGIIKGLLVLIVCLCTSTLFGHTITDGTSIENKSVFKPDKQIAVVAIDSVSAEITLETIVSTKARIRSLRTIKHFENKTNIRKTDYHGAWLKRPGWNGNLPYLKNI